MESPTETVEKQVVSLSDTTIKNKIRTLWLEGKEIKEILAVLEIPKGTWDSAYYLNTHALRDFVQDLKREYFLTLAENVSKEVMREDHDNNAKILAIKQKESEFLRETLGKDTGYSKRIETIGINLNKTEPLDADQKAKLDKIMRKAGQDTIKDVELVVPLSDNGLA